MLFDIPEINVDGLISGLSQLFFPLPCIVLWFERFDIASQQFVEKIVQVGLSATFSFDGSCVSRLPERVEKKLGIENKDFRVWIEQALKQIGTCPSRSDENAPW